MTEQQKNMSVANGLNIEIQEAAGGVTAAAGFVAGGLHAGLKKCPDKKDLAIIHSLVPAVVGGVFTQNKFAAAPVNWCRQVVAGGRAQAVVVNSGTPTPAPARRARPMRRKWLRFAARLCKPRRSRCWFAAPGLSAFSCQCRCCARALQPARRSFPPRAGKRRQRRL